MRDLDETQVRERLSDLAGGIRLRPELERPTMRRARRRRLTTAGGSLLVVVALLAGSVAGVRAFLGAEPTRFADDPPAETFEGAWPETDAAVLAETQRAVDDGDQPLRADPVGTATLLATTLFGWSPEDCDEACVDHVERSGPEEDRALVVLTHARVHSDLVPPISVELAQLGRTGANGVWSVTGVTSPLIELDPVRFATTSSLTVSGRLTDLFEGGASVAVHVLDGATFDTAIAQARVTVGDGLRFEARLDVPATLDGRVTVLVWVPDAVGMSLGTTAFTIETEVGEPVPGDPGRVADVTGIPSVVAATAQRIHAAALARDFDALAGLLDPNTFAFNFDDGSDPIPAWRQDPAILDTIALVLELPPTSIDVEGMGLFYVWPYLTHLDVVEPTADELRDLERLGITVEEFRQMVEALGGYAGPRLSIDATGLWRNFVTGGD